MVGWFLLRRFLRDNLGERAKLEVGLTRVLVVEDLLMVELLASMGNSFDCSVGVRMRDGVEIAFEM